MRNVLVVLAVALTIAGCATARRPSPVVAVVNDHEITAHDVTAFTAAWRQERIRAPHADDEPGATQALDRLIANRILLQEAERERILVDDADVTEELGERLKQMGVPDREAFETSLKAHGLSTKDLRERIRDSIKTARLIRRKITLPISVRDSDIDEYLAQNRHKLEAGLDARDASRLDSLPQLRKHLQDVLFRQQYEARYAVWFEELKRRATIEIRTPEAERAPPTSPSDVPRSSRTTYLATIRAKIQKFWTYPCGDDSAASNCTYVEARLTVEANVEEAGALSAVKVLESSGSRVHDDAAVYAVKLASPFDPIPDDAKAAGLPMHVRINFQYSLAGSRIR